MDDPSGFFFVHRKLWGKRSSPKILRGPASKREAWIYLCGCARWAAGGGLDVGEFAESQRQLSDVWGWSRTQVRRFFVELEAEGMIELVRPGTKRREPAVYRVMKWREYQRGAVASFGPVGDPVEVVAPQEDAVIGDPVGDPVAEKRPKSQLTDDPVQAHGGQGVTRNGDPVGDPVQVVGGQGVSTSERPNPNKAYVPRVRARTEHTPPDLFGDPPNAVGDAIGRFLSATGARWPLKQSIGTWALAIGRDPAYGGLDIPRQIMLCAEWWEGEGKKPRRPDKAIRNWLRKARDIESRDNPDTDAWASEEARRLRDTYGV